MGWPWVVAIVAGVLLAGGAAIIVLALWARRGLPAEQARRLFLLQREHLEAHFLRAANASGKPRGLRWKECDWDGPVVFARDRATGQFAALAGVTIRFEAVEGGDMEGLPAVANLRNASAVFVHEGGRWHATGRTVFNLSPDEVLRRFEQQYEPLETG